jgi:cell division protein FtsN
MLPQWQRVFGMAWIGLPALVVIVSCFFLFGWLMNWIGALVIRRQVAEAAVWERAGMNAEAEAAFEQTKSLYDSFWLSPAHRKRISGWVTRRLARFYLVHRTSNQNAQATVISYLYLSPQDQAMVEGWLEAVLHREYHTREEHDLAGKIAEAQAGHIKIQKLLMQFFLANGRVDFEAMQTYRRIWSAGMPSAFVKTLSKVLLNEAYIDDWALQVYFKAYELGVSESIEGLAAGVHLLRPNEENRFVLNAARQIVSTLEPEEQQALVQRLAPLKKQDPQPPKRPLKTAMAKAGQKSASVGHAMGQKLRKWPQMVVSATGRVVRLRQFRPQARSVTIYVILMCMFGGLLVTGWHILGTKPESVVPAKRVKVPILTPVSDPFTIQVGAYLTPDDAQKFVDGLKKEGIDAFFTKATSSNRAWYQVKVSHFASQEEASRYGEQLKTQGLIDDFYVSNYSRR